MIKSCYVCGKPFQTKSNRAKYCSYECTKAYDREHGKAKREKYKAMKAAAQFKEKSVALSDKVAAANDAGMSYGEMAAIEQAKAIKIERKPLAQEPKRRGRPKKAKDTAAPIIYEYRKIQFDEMVEQWLFNEAQANG